MGKHNDVAYIYISRPLLQQNKKLRQSTDGHIPKFTQNSTNSQHLDSLPLPRRAKNGSFLAPQPFPTINPPKTTRIQPKEGENPYLEAQKHEASSQDLSWPIKCLRSDEMGATDSGESMDAATKNGDPQCRRRRATARSRAAELLRVDREAREDAIGSGQGISSP